MSSQTKRRRVARRGSVSVTMVSGVASPPRHADILRRGPAAWSAWRKRNPNIVPDLAGVALELGERALGPADGGPIDLHAALLEGAMFRFAVLSGANLEGAGLAGGDLAHSHLDGANLKGANAGQARLDHADLTAAHLSEVDFHRASLRFANLSGADLEAADLSGSDLVHARLSGANLSGANLSKTRLDHADFDGAVLTDANLAGASLHHVKNLTARQLASARGSRTTILPPELQGTVPWSAPKDPAGVVHAERSAPLPQPGPAARLDVPDAAPFVRPVFLVGALSAVTVVGLGLAGDQLSIGTSGGGGAPAPGVQQVLSVPLSGSPTVDVAPTRAKAPAGEVAAPPAQRAAPVPPPKEARIEPPAPLPLASVDPRSVGDKTASAPGAHEEAVEPPQNLAADQPDHTSAAAPPVRPAVLLASALLPAGALLEVGAHGARLEARVEAYGRHALATEPLRVATASHAVAAVETSARFDRPALSASILTPSPVSHGTALEARTELAVAPALAVAEPQSDGAGHGIAPGFAPRAPVPPALTAIEDGAVASHAIPRLSRETIVPPALTTTEHSTIASHAVPGASRREEARVRPALTVAEPALAPHGSLDVAVAATHAVADAILPSTRHGFGMTEVEGWSTVHALGADGGVPSRHEQPQPAPLATALVTPAVFEVTTPPAIAKKERAAKAKAEAPAVAAAIQPLTLVVSLNEQKIDVYRGTVRITSAKVSSGMPGHETRTGVFSILEKQRYHRSNLYSGAPMPWMQRLTRSGTAIHAGVVPGHPASHGCIRLPFSFAPKLFEMTAVGENVVVAGARLVPELIDHPKLFQPVVRQAPQVAVKEPAAAPQSEGAPGAARAAPYVILASQSGGEIPLGAWREQQAVSAAVEPGEPHALSLPEDVDASAHASAPALAVPDSVGDHAVVVTMSLAPLRMLITRRTERHRLIGVQYLLSSMGFLAPQNFDGTFGKATVAAIKAFRRAHDLPETTALSDGLIDAVYKAAGKEEPPQWHLFVRQNFSRLFDVPVTVRDPGRPLGTHIFTATRFVPGDANVEWTEIDLEGGDGARALDRIGIPGDARRRIAARLTPGSALIIGDASIDSAILPEGDDFLVWTEETPPAAAAKSRTARADEGEAVKAPNTLKTLKIKKSRPAPAIVRAHPKREDRVGRNWRRAQRAYTYQSPRFGRSGLFSSW
jgi:uncharacterized protein YjbI with pentapeptide repeats/lipoprotein-anchoring transpeptidase ErfK/SrfK/peptidoglycan hydrolase-like protein with peptidoglycan-binding domain